MIQRGHRPRFALETGAQILSRGNMFRQDFHRDRAIKPRVARLVHLAHAPGAKGERISYGPSLSPIESGMCLIQLSVADQDANKSWMTYPGVISL